MMINDIIIDGCFISSFIDGIGIVLFEIWMSSSEVMNFIYSWLHFAFKDNRLSRIFLASGYKMPSVHAVTNIVFFTMPLNIFDFIGIRKHR